MFNLLFYMTVNYHMNDFPPATHYIYTVYIYRHIPANLSGLYFFLLVIRYHHVDMEMDRTPCVVHTIQLVVHMLQKETTVKIVLDKARSVVKLFR